MGVWLQNLEGGEAEGELASGSWGEGSCKMKQSATRETVSSREGEMEGGKAREG